MNEMAGMAGFFGAHGVWSVSDGETLVPLLGHEYADGRKGMDRLVHEELDDAVQAGRAALEAGRSGWVRAVLVVDAYLHLEAGRFDALIVNAVEYIPSRRSLQMAIPYRPASSTEGFAVYRPKFIDVAGVDEPDHAALAEAFFTGVDSHEQAAATWDAHLVDESV